MEHIEHTINTNNTTHTTELDHMGDLKFHIEKSLHLLTELGVEGNFNLIQIDIKLKEALAWLNQKSL